MTLDELTPEQEQALYDRIKHGPVRLAAIAIGKEFGITSVEVYQFVLEAGLTRRDPRYPQPEEKPKLFVCQKCGTRAGKPEHETCPSMMARLEWTP